MKEFIANVSKILRLNRRMSLYYNMAKLYQVLYCNFNHVFNDTKVLSDNTFKYLCKYYLKLQRQLLEPLLDYDMLG